MCNDGLDFFFQNLGCVTYYISYHNRNNLGHGPKSPSGYYQGFWSAGKAYHRLVMTGYAFSRCLEGSK